ncbi:hypothetical protein ES707_14228 [subsurface metagenome]
MDPFLKQSIGQTGTAFFGAIILFILYFILGYFFPYG